MVDNDGLASHRLAAVPLRPIPKAVRAAGVAALGLYTGQATKYRRNDHRILDLAEPAAPGSPAFLPVAGRSVQHPLRKGTVWVLRIGNQIPPPMIKAIAGARVSVDLSNYILCPRPWPGPSSTPSSAERVPAWRPALLLGGWRSAKRNAQLATDLERAGVTAIESQVGLTSRELDRMLSFAEDSYELLREAGELSALAGWTVGTGLHGCVGSGGVALAQPITRERR